MCRFVFGRWDRFGGAMVSGCRVFVFRFSFSFLFCFSLCGLL